MEGSSPASSIGYRTLDNASYSEISLNVENIRKWTNKEIQILENLDEENKARLPNKNIGQIQRQMDEFVSDLATAEEGKAVNHVGKSASTYAGSSSQRKEKAVRWTEEEHKAFLVGLEVYGKGNWSSISKVYVPTKTTSQVASHGQKYFRRVQSKTPSQKRRCSIHDTRILGSGAIVHISPRLISADSAALNASWQGELSSNSGRYQASSMYPEDQQLDGSTPFNHFAYPTTSASYTQEQEQEEEDPDFLYMLRPFSP
ncbi:hypothetical protein V2J09_016364 [Rumex salicifolius]